MAKHRPAIATATRVRILAYAYSTGLCDVISAVVGGRITDGMAPTVGKEGKLACFKDCADPAAVVSQVGAKPIGVRAVREGENGRDAGRFDRNVNRRAGGWRHCSCL